MSDLDNAYDPKVAEEKWYTFWEEKGYFKADPHSEKEPYCIVLPPPNVTGQLHMGHALVNTLQDIMIRFKKMQGYETLWIPGTDHAGIATQSVVERHLYAKTGKRKRDFTREEFLSQVWTWKEEHQGKILHQLRKLGCALDWSKLRFTMDEPSTKAVKALFKKLFDQGLIYRGDYLVHWDTVLETAIADDEVEHEERESFLWHIRYPIADSTESIVVATTRPETMLGDVAVAVSLEDPRYKHLIGKKVFIPLINREIPIIADSYVDPEFGTGALKITPAHDFNDYEIGKRHGLDLINILHPNGILNDNAYDYRGLNLEEARKKIVDRLEQEGFLIKKIPHTHKVGISYRSKSVVEPFLSKQWFIRMEPFKKDLIDAVAKEEIKIVPEAWDKVYFHWINNIRDWCISRQLWWGHRIPIWYNKKNPEKILCYVEEDLPPEVRASPDEWVQDEDVLDTWFSSALWPLTTLGWPENTADLEKFYPNAVLITGHDILFFWVARMILVGQYVKKEVPFKETFIHGLIYGKSYWRTSPDGKIAYVSAEDRLSYELGAPVPKDVEFQWEKMSKTKGNVIDPIEILSSYGTDALRLALASSVTHTKEIDLDMRKFEEYKNFCNKLWNASRFIFMHASSGQEINPSLFTLDDRWILSKLHHTIVTVTNGFNHYLFADAVRTLYSFFWDEFCAYYLETTKPFLFGKVGTEAIRSNKVEILRTIYLSILRLLHPLAPFITEELFAQCKKVFLQTASKELLPLLSQDSLLALPFPEPLFPVDEKGEKDFSFVMQAVHTIRNVRGEMQIPSNTSTDVYMVGKQEESLLLFENQAILSSLVRIRALHFREERDPSLTFATTAHIGPILCLIPLPSDLLQKEKERLSKELEKEEKKMLGLQNRLSSEEFISKAPKEVVLAAESDLRLSQTKQKEISSKLFELRSIPTN